jgi:undecaprenyl diphosphate synthase
VQDVDLIIRTGGEQRLSDFLLWEGAYAELYFTGVMWPDFGRRELQAAIAEFHGRERRFGSVPAVAAAVATAAAGSLPPTPAVAAGSGPAAAPAVAAGV